MYPHSLPLPPSLSLSLSDEQVKSNIKLSAQTYGNMSVILCSPPQTRETTLVVIQRGRQLVLAAEEP